MRHLLMVGAISFQIALAPTAECAESSQLQLRENGPALTPEKARALGAPALGDALLALGHPPITEVTIGPEGMEAPPAPNTPIVTRIKLYSKPIRSVTAGFCERIVASVFLAPADRLPDRSLQATPASRLSIQTAYRWVGRGNNDDVCVASKYNFFIPEPSVTASALEAANLLGLASLAAKQGRRLPYPVSVNDLEGPSMLAFERQHPELARNPELEVITDAKKALASLPVDAVSFAGPSASFYRNVLDPADNAVAAAGGGEEMTISLGQNWTVGIIVDDHRIKVMRILREIPAPS